MCCHVFFCFALTVSEHEAASVPAMAVRAEAGPLVHDVFQAFAFHAHGLLPAA